METENHHMKEKLDTVRRRIYRIEPRETPRQSTKGFRDDLAILAEARDEMHAMPVPDPTDPNSMASYKHFLREQSRRQSAIRNGVQQPMELLLLEHFHLPWRSRSLGSEEQLALGESDPLLDDQPDISEDRITASDWKVQIK